MKNKNRILITGGTGFIGSHLCEYYVQKGYKVTSFDRYNVNYDLGNLHNSAFKKDNNFILETSEIMTQWKKHLKTKIQYYI